MRLLTFWTTASNYSMNSRYLLKVTMNWAYNSYWSRSIYIFNFTVIIFISMYFYRSINKFFFIRKCYITFITSLSSQMMTGILCKISMNWTSYNYWSRVVNIFNFTVIIFISMYFFCSFYEFFLC